MWVAAAVSVGTAVYGAYSSNKAADSQTASMDQQYELGLANLDFQKDQFAWSQEEYEYNKQKYEEDYQLQLDRQQDYMAFGESVYAQAQESAELQRIEANRQYQDWESMFGPIQDNLANYYASMDPKDFARQGKGTIDEAYTQASDALQKNLAQRGIQGGGVEAGAQAQLESSTALARGQNVIQSELAYNQAQQGFLASGNVQSQAQANYLQSLDPQSAEAGTQLMSNAFNMLPNQSTASLPSTAGVGTAYNSLSNTMSQQAAIFGQQSAAGASAVASGIGSFMDSGILSQFGGTSMPASYVSDFTYNQMG